MKSKGKKCEELSNENNGQVTAYWAIKSWLAIYHIGNLPSNLMDMQLGE